MTNEENEQAEKDLLELADISTDKQIEELRKQRCKRKEEKTEQQ